MHDADIEGRHDVLIEAVVAPDSDLAGRTIGDIDFPRRGVRRDRMPSAVGIIIAVVAHSSRTLPIVASAMTGALLMVIMGCLRPEEAYDAVNWQVVLLLAGVLSLGVALQQTGGADLMADTMLAISQPFGLVAIVAGFFLLAFLLTELISNNATAALLAPVAINAAQTLAADPRPLLVAVTFAASFSFLTPTGYPTNLLLVYGPGQYRYSD